MNSRLTTFVAIVALSAYAVLSTITCNGLKVSRDRVENNAKGVRDSLHDLVMKNGIKSRYIAAQEGTIAELKTTNAAIIDDRENKIGLKDRQIEGAQNVIARMQIAFDDLVNMERRHDTVETVDHVDSNNAFHAVVTEDTTGKRTIHVVDTPTVDIHLTEYTGKWNLLKPFATTSHYINAYSNNRKARITGLESVLVVKEKPKVLKTAGAIGIGIIAGLVIHHFVK